MLSRGSWGEAGWAPWFKGRLGSPELCILHGNGGSLGFWLRARRGRDEPDEKPWLEGGLGWAPQELLRAADASEGHVVAQITFLAHFRASLGTNHVSPGPWPLPYLSNQS